MKKPLTTAAWAAIIGIILGIINFILLFTFGDNIIGQSLISFISLIGGLLNALFLYGYVVLGRKFNVVLLQVMAWIGIVLMILFGVFAAIETITPLASAQEIGGLAEEGSGATALLVLLLAFWITFAIILGTYIVLFGVGVLKLGDKIRYAKAAGILKIIAGATLVIFVGFLVGIVAYIFEIMLMFNAAKKFER